MNYKNYTSTLRAISGECSKVGIPCVPFIEIAQKMLKINRNNSEFEQKALSLLKDYATYGEARCKVLGVPDIKTLCEIDKDFLVKGFMYHVSTEEGVDAGTAKFAAFCNIQLDMFNINDMENLQKDVIKRMNLSTSLKDPDYWDKLVNALPEYIKGDYPAKTPSKVKQWVDSLDLPSLKEKIPLTVQFSKYMKTLCPTAREAYGFIEGLSDVEKELVVVAFKDTRASMAKQEQAGRFSLYMANDIYCIVTEDKTIIWEGSTDNVWFTLKNMPDGETYAQELLSRMPVQSKLDVADDEEESPNPYGVEEDTIGDCKVYKTTNANYLLVDKSGVIRYTSSIKSNLSNVDVNNMTNTFMMESLEKSFGMTLKVESINNFLNECASTLVHEKLPKDPVAKLFCLLPLIKENKNKL